jgi:tetratricopeptide (TPR) repeat protein
MKKRKDPPHGGVPPKAAPVSSPKPGFRLPSEPIATAAPAAAAQTLTIEQALQLAAQHQEAGRLQQAEDLVRQVLQVRPNSALAWHTLGLVAHASNKPQLAIEFVGRAVECDPTVALFHANLAEMNRLQKNIDEAIACGLRAVKCDPNQVSAHTNLGIAYFDNDEFDKAEACHRKAIALDPTCAPSLNNLGSVLRERKDDEAALSWYEKALAAQPGYLEPLNNIGATLVRMDRPEEAIKVLQEAITRNPGYAEAHCNLGFALLELEKIKPALECFTRALHYRPDYPEAYVGLARVHKEEYLLDAAEKHARTAIAMEPDSQDAWCVLGTIQTAQGVPGEARKSFEKALEIDPELTGAHMGLGNLLLEDGHIEAAERIFREAGKDGYDRTSTLFSLVQARKMKKDDPEIAELEAMDVKTLPPNKAIYVHFALGKAYDDTGVPDKAFPHFIEGCRIKRARLTYDADEKDRIFASVRETFSKKFIDERRGGGCKSELPIFVLGMPRSGTTLTEQIIASHPDVFGAGEIFDLLDAVGSRTQGPQEPFPCNIAKLDAKGLAAMGQSYVDGLRKRDKAAKRITDKMPINFLHIGIIHLILPKAKIVHVHRHPLDTCISCFTRLFAHNQDATYELKELGRFYRAYYETMQHWKKVLPKGAYYDIRYEKLVENTDEEARKLIDYCGLDWNDACLEFHKTERTVRTASVTQVRQPIYKSSLARWKKYEKFLGPLIEGLGPALEGEET